MVLRSGESARSQNGRGNMTQFQFVSVQTPNEPSDKTTKRIARSHAVKQALENKRRLQQASMQNFCVRTVEDEATPKRTTRKRKDTKIVAPSPVSLSASMLDPFQSLAVDTTRLQVLLNDFHARQAPEPVFSVEEELGFQNFRTVFRAGLVDPALLHALMLSLAFTASGGVINKECLVHRGQAIQYIRERMGSLEKAVSESTIGAILLLVGVEARLGTTSQVQLHMGAVQYLLAACQTAAINLTEGIKRAIFWQDLNSSVMVGSRRIVDHTTFAELQWTRESTGSDFFQLPPGFKTRSHLFHPDFLEALEDIHALQCIRNFYHRNGRTISVVAINRHTASIQSRLAALQKTTPISKCCYLAAYVCSVMLCCKIWCALVIPSNISIQLLHELQRVRNDFIWDGHEDLLLWLVCIGGACAPAGTVRSNYTALLRSTTFERLSRAVIYDTLRQFIWSDRAFKSKVREFLDESFV